MSIFTPQAPTGLFALCTDGGGPTQALTFTRRATPITQDSGGEILVSFAALGTFTGDLQPDNGRFPRMVQGTLQQVNYDFIVLGNPDLRVGDRCTISGVQTEIIGTNVLGLEYVNCLLKELR